ncbi:MAG: response regulator transcription factor [Chloroflexi bacterium]|nr:response regulator transcription factor [Chloroflexota bacterium]MBU1746695.1 response regulator transcription factor [Chloroflexota bacterium]MBU1880138.1 response regulator transcription factor [Chloroflexota bacterium]
MTELRVLIADDHLVVREGLRTILEVADDFEVVGEAADGAEAVQQAGALQPDVVLMDLRMPHVDGIAAIQQIKARWPQIEVVILTTYDDDQNIVQGLRAGARGYLLKDTDRQTLYAAIRAAARGESLLPPAVAARLLARLESPAPPSPLSDREQQVLALLAEGKRNKDIAEQLVITERTVKAHVTSIFNKLEVNSRAEVIAVALRDGLLPAGLSQR